MPSVEIPKGAVTKHLNSLDQPPVAHVRPGQMPGSSLWHMLDDHLRCVAGSARRSASAFDAADWGWLAGLWHDLGKYRPGFQRYIRQAADADARKWRARQ